MYRDILIYLGIFVGAFVILTVLLYASKLLARIIDKIDKKD